MKQHKNRIQELEKNIFVLFQMIQQATATNHAIVELLTDQDKNNLEKINNRVKELLTPKAKSEITPVTGDENNPQ